MPLTCEFATLDAIFVHVVVVDAQFTILHVKPETAALLDYDASELEGRPLETIVVERLYPALRFALKASRQKGARFLKVVLASRGGRLRPLRLSLFRLEVSGHELFVGVGDRLYSPAHAIARQKRAREKELRALYAIDKFLHSAESQEDALSGLPSILARAMMYPQQARVRICFDDRVYTSGPMPGDGGNGIAADLVINRIKRGRIEICYIREHQRVLREALDMLAQVSSFVSAVIERKETAEKLQQNSIQLQTLFAAITDLVFTVDGEFQIKMVNRQLDVIGRRCYEAFFGLTAPCEGCPAYVVKRTRQPARKADQHIDNKFYRVNVYPVFDPGGEVTDTLEIARDITSEKNMQAQLIQADKLASLGQLVSGIAHEINNPNTFIRGNISILAEALDTILPLLDRLNEQDPGLTIARLPYAFFREHVQTLVSDIRHGADKIMSIVSDLKKFARHDEGLLAEDVDINAAVESCLRLVHNQVKRAATIHLHLAPTVPVFKGNVQKIEQVLVNIIINAAQAVEEKRETGNIWITTAFGPDASVRVAIRDDGPGMTEEHRKRIFDPFFTTRRHRRGTGLGLSIAYGIMAEHCGSIQVESTPGKGSEFTLVIPLRQPSVERSQHDPPNPPWR
jgi:signal transduction histidine kinase